MEEYRDITLDRDRAFDTGSINELLTQGKSILTEAISISGKMDDSLSSISSVYSGIDGEYKVGALGSDIGRLSGTLKKDIYQDTIDRMDKILTKLIEDMPLYDNSLSQSVDGIRETLDSVKGRISELRGLLEVGDVNLNYTEFSRRLKDLKAGWDESTEDLAEQLAEIEHDMLGVSLTAVQYSSDPVNLSTGNFVYDHEDLKIDGEIPLFFHRYYNSKDRIKGSMGRCFVHNYEICLKENEEKGKVVICMGDGQKKSFQKISDGTYQSLYSVKEFLSKEDDNYVLLKLSGMKYIFDKKGKLVREENRQKKGITFQYDEFERLKKAETDNNTFLTYSYNEIGLLIQVEDHVGRTVTLSYKKGKLAEVKTPQESYYTYHYGKNGRIEEVVNPCGHVVVKNSYDDKRRIVRQAFPDGGYMEYTYDDSKRQVVLTERNKSKIIYVHDRKYRNTDILYEDGTKEHFEYNGKNQRILHVDRNGKSTRMAYDNKGNMTQIINPLGVKFSITYDFYNNPTNIKINGKEKQKNVFDRNGNLVEIKDALLRRIVFTYDKAGYPVDILQPDGGIIHLVYDKKGNIIEYDDARRGKTYYTYDNLNRIIEITDPNGNITYFSYDQAGNICSITNSAGNTRSYEYNKNNKVTKIIDFDGSIIQREYNALGKLKKITDQMGRVTRLHYDVMWNLAGITEPNGAKTTYSYNENNYLSQIKDAYGNARCYTYDGNGNKLTEIDENGMVTHFSYDACGRLIHVKGPDGMKYDYTYDAEGNLTEVKDAIGGIINREYDAAGQLIREINQMGECRSYTYSPLGKVESVIDETGRKTLYKYLPGGLLETIITPEKMVEKYTYDRNGNIKTYTNAEGLVLTYNYDCLNRITCIEGSDGEKKKYTYDAVGNIISVTDGLNNKTKYEYTFTGQLSKVIDSLGNETEYTYDECDKLIEIRQYGEKIGSEKECHITKCERDLLGRVRTIVDPLGLKEHYKYDSKGQLLEKIDKEGYLTQYGYTGQGDINHIQYADGREVKLSYNPLRQLCEIEDWIGLTKIETDPLGRAIKVLYPDDKEISYTYGKAGRRTSITYPDGKKVFYDYDKDFRLSELIRGDKIIKYDYDRNGRLIKKSFPNQTETMYSYDIRGRIKQLVHMDKEGVLDKFTYQYDLLGNKTAINKERKGLPEESGLYTFNYDSMGRLADVSKNGQFLRSYSYDSFGNRTGVIEENRETVYTYNAINQLLFKVDNNGETKYTFDKRGNLTQILENGNIKNQYFYGAINRLEQAVNQKGEIAQYQYNGLGCRIEKKVGKMDLITENQSQLRGCDLLCALKEQKINWDRNISFTIDLTKQYNNLLQKEEMGNVQTYLWDSGIIGVFNNSMTCPNYYLQDELGSPIRMTDENGKPIEYFGYDEFGANLYYNQSVTPPFGYTGYQYDDIAETYFAQAREYDCKIGRFNAVDPYKGNIYESNTLNNYIYCINNPLIYFDPLGLFPAWLEGIWAHIQIELELQTNRFKCNNTSSNVRIPGAGTGITGVGIADFLVDYGTHVEIYEIKPDTWASGYLHSRALNQLNRYVSGYRNYTGRTTREGSQVFSYSVPFYRDPSRTLTYWSAGDGLIYYSISPPRQTNSALVPVAKPISEKEFGIHVLSNGEMPVPENPGYQLTAEIDFRPIFIGACFVVAGVISIVLLADDILTGGIGSADNIVIPAIWAWVFSI